MLRAPPPLTARLSAPPRCRRASLQALRRRTLPAAGAPPEREEKEKPARLSLGEDATKRLVKSQFKDRDYAKRVLANLKKVGSLSCSLLLLSPAPHSPLQLSVEDPAQLQRFFLRRSLDKLVPKAVRCPLSRLGRTPPLRRPISPLARRRVTLSDPPP